MATHTELYELLNPTLDGAVCAILLQIAQRSLKFPIFF